MTSTNRIFTKLASECYLDNESLVQQYVMNRKTQIINEHVANVFPIKAPGERGGDPKYWLTKLTPGNRNHDGKIRAKTREELEEKILCHYLEIADTKRLTVYAVLDARYKPGRTKTRLLERLHSNLPTLEHTRVCDLNEQNIRTALDELVAKHITADEFSNTMTCLNMVQNYCNYNHIDCANIRQIVADWKGINTTGKKVFCRNDKSAAELAFTKAETQQLIEYARDNQTSKSLFVATLLTTGVRISELLALDISKINLTEHYLRVVQEVNIETGEIEEPKEGKKRTVYLTPLALEIIKSAIKLRDMDDYETDRLFINELAANKVMDYSDMFKYLTGWVHEKVLGLGSHTPRRSPHDCRRTYASLEYVNGTPLNVISAQLGHANASQTWEYIQNVVEETERLTLLRGVVDAEWTQGGQQKKPQNNVISGLFDNKCASC